MISSGKLVGVGKSRQPSCESTDMTVCFISLLGNKGIGARHFPKTTQLLAIDKILSVCELELEGKSADFNFPIHFH